MTYATDRASVQNSAPREIYDFTVGGGAYRYTSCRDDITYGGLLYTATQISRNNATQFETSRRREMIVTLPADNEIVGLLINSGIPRRKTGLVITSIEAGGDVIQVWNGRINGLNTQDEWAQLRIPNRTDDALSLRLPVFKAQRLCNHILYGPGCTVSRVGGVALGSTTWVPLNSHVIIPSIVSANGVSVTIGSMFGQPDGWANGGEIRANGDSRSIITQVGTTLTLDLPFSPQLVALQNVEVWQGCLHTQQACRDDFDNIENFGGHPHLPISNVIGPFAVGLRAK